LTTDERICRLIAVSGLTFRQVVSRDVRHLLLGSHHRDAPASHTSVKMKLDQFAQQITSQYRIEFEGLKKASKFSVVLDEWTSNSNRRYMSVIVRVFEKLGKEERIWNLGLQRMSGSDTAINCKQVLIAKLNDLGIDFYNDFVSIVTDGASVITCMAKTIYSV
jgi:hypothetical protein